MNMNAPPPHMPLMQAFRVVAITYEKQPDGAWLPVVRHEFYGPTPDRALHVYRAHLESDSFFGACQAGHYKGIECRTMTYQVERVTG